MSLTERLLKELIDKLHMGKHKDAEKEPSVVEMDVEAAPKEGLSESPRVEALKDLAGDQAEGSPLEEAKESPAEELAEVEAKPVLKHNHSIIKEECGPGCPMHDSQAK